METFQERLDYGFNLLTDLASEYVQSVYEYVYLLPLMNILQNYVVYILIVLYLIWYLKAYLSKTELISKDGSDLKETIEKFPSFQSSYTPTIWCFQSFFNTVVFGVLQRCMKINYEREILNLPDGGQLALDWENRKNAKNKLVMLLLPGLSGSSYSSYITHYVDKAKKKSCIAVAMNYRGIELGLKTTRIHCATDHEDLAFVVNHIKKSHPDHCIFAVGTSIGGLLLGNFLANPYGSDISYAMIVSAPFNAEQTLIESEKYFSLVFNKLITNSLIKLINNNKHLFENEQRVDVNQIVKCKSMRELFYHYNAKYYGFQTVEAFYATASMDSKVQNIKIPTIFLNAADDSLSPYRAFPLEKLASNPNTALIMTKFGGHVSFVEGILPTGCNFCCRLLIDYLNQILNEINRK